MDFSYKFPVVAGIQAGKQYFIAMVPLRMISKLFPDEEEFVSPEYRAQRKLNESRIPVISKYITDNRDSYVFSALAASIDGEFRFYENDNSGKTGILEVSMDAKFLINDGQHRKAAILDALKEDESLGDETISIVLYEDLGLARSQQIFTDLNKHAVKTSNSISELYDSRDELAVVTRNVIARIPFLDEYVDKERDILGKFSSSLFTLNTFYTANKRILSRKKIDYEFEEFLLAFWSSISKHMIPWKELDQRELTKTDLREQYIASQAVVIQALGKIGGQLFDDNSQMEERLCKLEEVNWKRNWPGWKLRVIRSNGRMINNEQAIGLTAIKIKEVIGFPLTEDEMESEKEFLKSIGKK